MDELSSAEFSECRKYRYILRRTWSFKSPVVTFIGLNPSTADHVKDDPTIRRCRNFAKGWGFGGMLMVNLFAFRATEPRVMMGETNPIGIGNNGFIIDACDQGEIAVACWGTNGQYMDRDKEVISKVEKLYYLKLTKAGHPSHPLYLKMCLRPKEWNVK